MPPPSPHLALAALLGHAMVEVMLPMPSTMHPRCYISTRTRILAMPPPMVPMRAYLLVSKGPPATVVPSRHYVVRRLLDTLQLQLRSLQRIV